MRIFFSFILLLFATVVFANNCGPEKTIIQKPILFNAQRMQLTQQYRLQHYGIKSPTISIIPQIIVLHWTTTATFRKSFLDFNSPVLKWRPEIQIGGALNTSAHFLIDRDGTIYQLMPETWMARHVIGLNNVAIGIENVGGVNNVADLTQAQVDSNAYLVCMLRHKYPTIKYLIGHYQYQQLRHSPLWLEKDPNYIDVKYDPGRDFMQQVCQRVKQYNVSGLKCLPH